MQLLEMYWELDKDTTEALLTRLERSGLLEKRVCKSKMFYIMQYICYNDIKLPPGSNMVNLHRRLLQNYRYVSLHAFHHCICTLRSEHIRKQLSHACTRN